MSIYEYIWISKLISQNIFLLISYLANIPKIFMKSKATTVSYTIISLRQYIIGQDWEFGDADGGPGSIGTVLDVRGNGNVVVSITCITNI